MQKCFDESFTCIMNILFSSFFFKEKNYLMLSLTMSVRPSVRLSVRSYVRRLSICLSIIGGNIFGTRLQYPIDLKFGLVVGGRVVHVCKERFFEIRIASCKFMQFNFLFFCIYGFDKPLFSI